MLKTKYALSAFGLLVAMTMATSAIAQNVLTISRGIEPRAREHGQTELAGAVTVVVMTASSTEGDNSNQGTLSIDYGVPITNRTDTPRPIVLTPSTGAACFA